MEYQNKKIAVLDFGGQYTHLINSKLRKLKAYSEIVSPKKLTPEIAKKNYSGIIFSGGPNSVYEKNTPKSDPKILDLGIPILGICYGHQLIIQQSGGVVKPCENAEYGASILEIKEYKGIFSNLKTISQVWMSHGDEIIELPKNYIKIGSTPNCNFAAVANLEKKHYGIQFHTEVNETEQGLELLKNFITECGLNETWHIEDFLEIEQKKIYENFKDKKILFLLSGGVDSTVAFTLIASAFKKYNCDLNNLHAIHIDTGFMREKESLLVNEAFKNLGVNIENINASEEFFEKLKNISANEEKRNIIGELFIKILKSAFSKLGNLEIDKTWILGQGTIYPDHVESGANDASAKIKTHHNRVEIIQKLIKEKRVIEPLENLYKDEVRILGKLLGLPDTLILRHPFPGPGLAIRCLCTTKSNFDLEKSEEHIKVNLLNTLNKTFGNEFLNFKILLVKSVGVQGDKRSYKHCVSLEYNYKSSNNIDWNLLKNISSNIPNQFSYFNRTVLDLGFLFSKVQKNIYLKKEAFLTKNRIEVLTKADQIVSEFFIEKNIYNDIWQAPVVLLPLQSSSNNSSEIETNNEEALVIRPVISMDAMTASVYEMKLEHLHELYKRLISIPEVIAVFYDLTSKPPGTIEWE